MAKAKKEEVKEAVVEAVEVKETETPVAKVVYPAAVAATALVATGKINYKKVALVTGGTIALAGLGYFGYKMYQKKKLNKESKMVEC